MVGLGFAGLQGYHQVGSPKKADFTNLILTGKYQKLNPEDMRKLFDQYNSIVNGKQQILDDAYNACDKSCKISFHNENPNPYPSSDIRHGIWEPDSNECICRGKYNGKYEIMGYLNCSTDEYWQRYTDVMKKYNEKLNALKKEGISVSDLRTICKSGCDYVCKGVGDPGHNIYNPNNSTCACRIN